MTDNWYRCPLPSTQLYLINGRIGVYTLGLSVLLKFIDTLSRQLLSKRWRNCRRVKVMCCRFSELYVKMLKYDFCPEAGSVTCLWYNQWYQKECPFCEEMIETVWLWGCGQPRQMKHIVTQMGWSHKRKQRIQLGTVARTFLEQGPQEFVARWKGIMVAKEMPLRLYQFELASQRVCNIKE
jgi:hypothetical protein